MLIDARLEDLRGLLKPNTVCVYSNQFETRLTKCTGSNLFEGNILRVVARSESGGMERDDRP